MTQHDHSTRRDDPETGEEETGDDRSGRLRLILILAAFILVPVLATLPVAGDIAAAVDTVPEQKPVMAFMIVIAVLSLDMVFSISNPLVGTLAGMALPWPAAMIAVWSGTMIASVGCYALGRWAARPLAVRIAGARTMKRAEAHADSLGFWLLFMSRPVPIVGELVMISAGLAPMKFTRFWWPIATANVFIAGIYVLLGSRAEPDDLGLIIFMSLVAIPGAALIGYQLFRRRRRG